MKSVVVEASTVAKAIETAWLKAGKPEEFFIRVLQEHSSGFLGFGALKAKVVFFFKNSQKSDSLFPVVLKQKEYSSFFGNLNLKVPSEQNSIDHELNKNVIAHGQQSKKKQHGNQNNQQKPKQGVQSPDVKPRLHNESHPKQVVHNVEKHASVDKNLHNSSVKQVKIQHPVKHQQSFVKNSEQGKPLEVSVHKPVHNKPKMQVTLQTAEPTKEFAEQKVVSHGVDKKDDVVKVIAKVLKKVQTQKIVANVSRPVQKISDKNLIKPGSESLRPVERPKSATPKFENYDDFINSTTGIPVPKEKHVEVSSIAPILSKIESLHSSIQNLEVRDKDFVVAKNESIAPVVQQVKPLVQAPRVPLKMKRRPLSTDNLGVSGITKSTQTAELVGSNHDVSKKNEQE